MTKLDEYDAATGAIRSSMEQTCGARAFGPSPGQRNVKRSAPRPMAPDLYDIRQAAKYLNCSVSSVRRRMEEGVLPYFKMNGKIQFEGRDLRRFMEAHRVEASCVSEPKHG